MNDLLERSNEKVEDRAGRIASMLQLKTEVLLKYMGESTFIRHEDTGVTIRFLLTPFLFHVVVQGGLTSSGKEKPKKKFYDDQEVVEDFMKRIKSVKSHG